ncbi:MAG: hypothetical protein NT002_05805 [candidate division Zixibacteria bacterium]|nr:hypothetical protein [candidate division Zixibacteria bacterium]
MERYSKHIQFLEHFVWAGSSAFLLLLAHFYPGIGFLSLFALVPFLWKAGTTDIRGSIESGIILSIAYATVAYPAELINAPPHFLFNLVAMGFILAVFALAVNRIRKHWGFNPLIIAILWLPLEYALRHLTNLGGIFLPASENSGLLIRIGSLFGSLLVSFLIVFLNSILILTFEKAFSKIRLGRTGVNCADRTLISTQVNPFVGTDFYSISESRAPPRPECLCI